MAFVNMATFRANGTIAPSIFVKIDTTADGFCLAAGSGDRPIGISQPGLKRAPGLPGSDVTIAAQQGDQLMVFGFQSVCWLQCSAAVVRGALLKPDASGFGLTTTTDTNAVGAVALQSGAGANALIQVQVVMFDI